MSFGYVKQYFKNLHTLTVKGTEHLFKGLYFLFTSVVGTSILRKSNFLPKNMMFPFLERNENSDIQNMYDNYPIIPYGEEVRLYFLTTLGYHALKTIE